MKHKGLLTVVFSIIFTTILTLIMIVIPSATASANQEAELQCKRYSDSIQATQGDPSNTRAVKVLKGIIDVNLQTSVVYLSLADLYCQADMYKQAESTYQKTIDKVKANLDVDVLISAKVRLADIKDKLKKPEEANRLREQAKAISDAMLENDLGREFCPDCNAGGGNPGEKKGSGVLQRCLRCYPITLK